MVAIVNGYVCFTTCDAKSARQGKDPNAPPGTPAGVSAKDAKPGSFDTQPAAVFGGALQDLLTSNAVTPAGASQQTASSPRPTIDRYA